MSNYNINAGYGKVSQAAPFSPTSKVFIVGDTSTVNLDMVKSIFGPENFESETLTLVSKDTSRGILDT